MQAKDIQEKKIKVSIKLRAVEGTSEKNYGEYLDLTKQDPLSTLKAFCVNFLVNLKIEQLQKISFMKYGDIVDFSSCESVYVGESRRSLKSRLDEH